MDKIFTGNSWNDYLYWQTQDKKTLKRINALLKDIDRNGNRGIAKRTQTDFPVSLRPEFSTKTRSMSPPPASLPVMLSGNFSGWWSRRIDEKNRLIYRIENGHIEILQCGEHYEDK